MSKKLIVICLLCLFVSCMQPPRYYYARSGNLPNASRLDFSVNELLSRLISSPNGYKDFPFQEVKIKNARILIYNVPEVGEVVYVTFYDLSKADTEPNSEWSFSIQYPKIRPNDLFPASQITRRVNPSLEWQVYDVTSGQFAGACLSDHSLSRENGFFTPNDRTIAVSSKHVYFDGKTENRCL